VPRHSFAAANVTASNVGDRGFVFGGFGTNGAMLSTAELMTGSVFCMNSTQTFSLPNGPLAGASAVFSTATGKVYLFGGNNGLTDINTVWELNPTTLTWTLKASMPTARSFAGATEIGNKLYVVGGKNGSRTLANLECYDPVTNTWTSRAPLPNAAYGLKFVHGSQAVWPTTFPFGYAMGGRGSTGTYLNQNYRYDPASNTWQVAASMPNGVAHFAGMRCYLPTGNGAFIAVMGGETAPGMATADSYIFDPVGNTWAPAANYGAISTCSAVSHFESFQTGDLNTMFFTFTSMGGRAGGAATTNSVDFLGTWAVLDGGQLQISQNTSEESFSLDWDYSGQQAVESFVMQVQGADGEFRNIGTRTSCTGSCFGSTLELGETPCMDGTCQIRMAAWLRDGRSVLSNVLEIASEHAAPQVVKSNDLVRINYPHGMGGSYELTTALGVLVKTGTATAGERIELNMAGLGTGMYLLKVRTPKAEACEKLLR
jgi:hypothetical protein